MAKGTAPEAGQETPIEGMVGSGTKDDPYDVPSTIKLIAAGPPSTKIYTKGIVSKIDEIDTGIGGKTAQMVAERIALVAGKKQVLCITHLPQIACMADVHYYLEKSAKDGMTSTTVRALPAKERAQEIARMASGADATAASLSNAKEMIARAAEIKKKFRKE